MRVSMKSAKCSACGLVGWLDGECCKKCGATLIATSSHDAHQAFSPYGNSQPWNAGSPNGKLKKGLAVCSLVIGIVSFLTLSLLGVGALLGIILASVALTKTNRNPSKYGGKGMAIAGLVLSITSFVTVVPVGIIAAIAIPNLLAARRAANEASSLVSLREIAEAEDTYYSVHQEYGTLEQLAAAQLINPDLAVGIRNGYKFKINASTNAYTKQPAFEAVAIPTDYSNSGRRSFYVDETWVIRAADARGAEATRFDPPLNFDSDYKVGSSSPGGGQGAVD